MMWHQDYFGFGSLDVGNLVCLFIALFYMLPEPYGHPTLAHC